MASEYINIAVPVKANQLLIEVINHINNKSSTTTNKSRMVAELIEGAHTKMMREVKRDKN